MNGAVGNENERTSAECVSSYLVAIEAERRGARSVALGVGVLVAVVAYLTPSPEARNLVVSAGASVALGRG